MFSWACGGGSGDAEGGVSHSLKIEMVYPEQSGGRQKFAVIDEDSLFRIGSDLNDPGDPNHATHAVAKFYEEGVLVAEGRAKLSRYSTDPGTVDPESREITITSVPQGVFLDLNISLGRNVNPNPDADIFEGFDTIFYQGSVNNLKILGDNVLVDGEESSAVLVPVKTYTDGELYTIQFFGDYSSVPLVAPFLEMLADDDDDAKEPIVSMSSLLNALSPSPDATLPQLISDNIFDFQAHFFEVPSVAIAEAPFDVILESGNHLIGENHYANFLLGAIVTPDEIATGNALLLDFETTITRVFTRIHEAESLPYATGNIIPVVKEIEKVYDRIEPLLNSSSVVLEIQIGDLVMLELVYLLAIQINTNQQVNFIDPLKLNTILFAQLPLVGDGGTAVNEFHFSKGGAPLRVLNPDGSLLMIIPEEISNLTTVGTNGNTITGSVLPAGNIGLRDLYGNNVTPYLNATSVWDHIYSVTDLDSVGPLEVVDEDVE